MNRMKIALGVAAIVALAMALPASAQPGPGPQPNQSTEQVDRVDAAAHDYQADDSPQMGGPGRKGRMPRWNAETVQTIRGEVVKIGRRAMPHGPNGTGMVVRTEDGPMPVILGPDRYLARHHFRIDPRDHVMVKGSVVEMRGRKVMIAQKIERDNEVLKLRRENGKPLWHKRGGPMMRGHRGDGMMREGRGEFRGPRGMGAGGQCRGQCDLQAPGDREQFRGQCDMQGPGGRGEFRGQCDMQGPGRFQGQQDGQGFGNPHRPFNQDSRRHMRRDVFNDD
jgi:hypothetical protein